jgi:hypothetical protein
VRSVPRRGLLQRVPGVLRRLCPARARLRSPLALPDFSSVRPSAALFRCVSGSLSFGSGSGGSTFGACNTREFIDAYLWHLPALPLIGGQRHRPAQAATRSFRAHGFNISSHCAAGITIIRHPARSLPTPLRRRRRLARWWRGPPAWPAHAGRGRRRARWHR